MIGRWLSAIVLVIVAHLTTVAALAQEKRVALVIGNNDYEHLNKLQTAVNDSRAMAETFRGLGFEVMAFENLDRRSMYRAIRSFADRLGGAIGVVYYAGHGVATDSGNQLLPVDIVAESDRDVELFGVALNDLLREVGAANSRLSIVFIDACRDNPLPKVPGRSIGLARGLRQVAAPNGLMVVYSAGYGEQALDRLGPNDPDPNGLFVRELLPELKTPGLALDDAIKRARDRIREKARAIDHRQNPAIYDQLEGGNVYLAGLPKPPSPPAAPVPAPVPAPVIGADLQAEVVFWQSIEKSGNPALFQAYLDRFGETGLFAPIARARIEAKAAPTPPESPPEEPLPAPSEQLAALPAPEIQPVEPAPDPRVIEDGLALTREDWRVVQATLAALGFDPRGIDGRPGTNTRTALGAWQRSKGLDAAGYLDSAQRQQLVTSADAKAVAKLLQKYQSGDRFKDCAVCPDMVVVPSGTFTMGSPAGEIGRSDDEGPQHRVTIGSPFAVGRFEVTFAEWDACVAGGGCNGYRPADEGWGRGNRPVINVSWNDVGSYVSWLSRKTGESYRLLSEAEWEYVARAGTTTPFHFGATISTAQANYNSNYTYGSNQSGEYRRRTVSVGSFPANAFGLHDVHGNVWEWVEDCWHDSHSGAPDDGSVFVNGACKTRVLHGGSWLNSPRYLRAAYRNRFSPVDRFTSAGFRVARPFAP